MKFAGERFVPAEQGKIRLEHCHRYAAVLDLVRGKDVLDVASGEGYGSCFLAGVSRTVIGVDISLDAVRHAQEAYAGQSALRFVHGSATQLDFPDASFDVVVSFETLEHLAEQAQMLAEFKRVLRSDGLLIISSPNRPVYSAEGGSHNAFHVKELDFNEFDALLNAQFPVVRHHGLRVLMGSIIQSIEGGQQYLQAWSDDGHTLTPVTATMTEPVYFVAICGDAGSPVPEMSASLLLPHGLDLVNQYVGFAKWAKSLDQTVAERDAHINDLRTAVATRDAHVRDLDVTMAARDARVNELRAKLAERDATNAALQKSVLDVQTRIDGLVEERDRLQAQVLSLRVQGQWKDERIFQVERELQEARAQILAMARTVSWRITLPIREVGRWIDSPGQQARRYANSAMRFAKCVLHMLPLRHHTKARFRNVLARYFPKLLLASGSHPTTIPALAIPQTRTAPHEYPSDLDGWARGIKLSRSARPTVSVIIPVYGKIEYTLRCLGSIAANEPIIEFEVIVVDDCSPDMSREILAQVDGIRMVHNERNQGFIRSCNAGAAIAVGEYLHFLNNDTEVHAGWLDELVRTFAEFPGTGLTGSKLVYPDGRLQEAGGIVWQDGSAWNFGRFQDPRLPMYNYAREVDFCSGASILVPRALFLQLGGFDEHYLPAYGEDSDLALKIRAAGYRVIYQPLSQVIHHEGVTSGTDTQSGVKACQVDNTRKLYERWKEHLQSHQPNGVDVDVAKDRCATRRVLVMDHYTPTPDLDAGSVTVYNLLLLLREMNFQVTFIPEENLLYMPGYTTSLQRAGVEVLYAPFATSVAQHCKDHGSRYDLAFLFRPAVVERHLQIIRKHCTRARVLYHTVDLHYLRMTREAELQADEATLREANSMKQRELAAISAADATIVHSTAEFDLLRVELPDARLHVFPLIMHVRGTSSVFADRRDIVFIGGYQHVPNVDAVQYFVSEIMPLLRQQLPGVRFYAVGSNPPAELLALASDDVIVTGYVEALDPLLDRMRISVAPLRFGAGIKGKIGSAMVVGLPVVATPLAAEGMSLTAGENILVADGAVAFANAVAEIYQNSALWNRLSGAGQSFAEQAWGAEAAWAHLATIMSELGMSVTRNTHDLSLFTPAQTIPKPFGCGR